MKAVAALSVLLTGLAALSGCAARVSEFAYSYPRPLGLRDSFKGERIIMPVVPQPSTLESGERKVEGLAQALGIKLEDSRKTRRVDRHGEVARLADGRFRFKIYVPSGMIRFRDTTLHNLTSEDDAELKPPTREQALQWARTVASSLSKVGLLDERELLFQGAHISFRREGDVLGAVQGQQGRAPLRASRPLDTRVFIPRVINGIGVSGHGLQMTFTHSGKLTGLDLMWRDLQLDERVAFPLKVTKESAKREFERHVRRANPGARIEVLVEELVYFDPAKRDAVNFLEPAYLFVYIVRTAIPGKGESVVSKKLHYVVRAVEHGRVQLPSARQKRYEELASRLGMKRPDKLPVPAKIREDED